MMGGMHRDLLILRDPKESWKRCSLAPLREVDGVRFVTWHPELELDVTGRLLLDPAAPVLERGELGVDEDGRFACPLFLIDSSWRRLATLRRAVVGEPIPRALPRLATAYPRRSTTFDDPEQGLASIEALFAATCLAGAPDHALLQGYHFKDAFLAANPGLSS
jgi:pre-rRNA-processing protein TSR3